MAVFHQDPHKLDSNVTINVPEKIEISYNKLRRNNEDSWYIVIDGVDVTDDGYYKKHFKDVSDAMDWLEERHLLKTKAYAELDKRVTKLFKKSTKLTKVAKS